MLGETFSFFVSLKFFSRVFYSICYNIALLVDLFLFFIQL